ncbi:MAG TPA: Ig-like domain-containing protein [Thermoleophilaceae bacterium]|nr:Ig-like domain-containing protein [Thermoleophilaceae bacterium]
MRRLLALPTLVLLAWAPGQALAATATGPKIARLDPASAVAGAAISIRGSKLAGSGTAVTVAGKRAAVLRARPRELRIVVPRVGAGKRVVTVRRGGRTATARLLVLRPFDGTVRVTVATQRSKAGTIGPSGGSITATGDDGTTYTLRVPAGALGQPHALKVSPIKQFSGLPFSGRALGVQFGPDGLRFAKPATLTITSKQPFPAGTVGFAYTNGTRVLEAQAPTGSGRARVLRVEHFSDAAVAGSNPADFANAVAPLLVESPMRLDVAERVLDLVAVYESAFPPAFCLNQPACENAKDAALASMTTRIKSRCAHPLEMPNLQAVREILEFEAMRRKLGADGDISLDCREQIMRAIFEPAREKACGSPGVPAVPLGRHSLIVKHTVEEGAVSDLDGDFELTNLEFMHFLVSQLQLAGLADMAVEAQDCFSDGFDSLPVDGKARCETDRPNAEVILQHALDYAVALGFVVTDYVEAMDFCRIHVAAAPTTATVDPAGTQQFTATVTDLIDPDRNSEVEWTATAGTIDQNGLYTAPVAEGTYEVTATSKLNPARRSTSTVTVGPVQYDLRVTLQAKQSSVVPEGASVTYEYTVTNAGPTLAPAAVVDIALTKHNVSCGGFADPHRTLGDLAPGATVTGTVSGSCSGHGGIDITVEASAAEGETDPSNNKGSVSTAFENPGEPTCPRGETCI